MKPSDALLAKMREDACRATRGRWKVWGMRVAADETGDSNVDTATPVADTYCVDRFGRPRTWDAEHIANFSPERAIALIDEVLALRVARDDLAQAIVHTREYVGEERLPVVVGWSWFDALSKHAPGMLPAGAPAQPLRGALHDEDHAREAQWQADRTGTTVAYMAEGGVWAEATPTPTRGWKAEAAERFREYGWTRLADLMARWDERRLGR